MKKLISIFLSVFILAIAFTNSFAQSAASFKEIKFANIGSQDKVSLNTSNYKGYKAFYMSNPDRLVVDIPNNISAVKGSGIINVKSSMLKSIRYSQFTKTSVRVVFDLKSKQQYTVEEKSGSLSFIFGKASAQTPGKPVPGTPAVSTPAPSKSPQITPAPSTPPPSTPAPSAPANRGDAERPPVNVQRLNFSTEANRDLITVSGSNNTGYTSMRLTNPDRIVVDIPNCTVPADQNLIPVDTAFIKSISYTQLDAKKARITVETNGLPQYRITDQQDRLELIVEAPSYRNITYSVQGETAILALQNARLEEAPPAESSGEAFTPLYTEIKDQTGMNYSISFPSSLADIGSGIMQISDNMLDTIVISRDLDQNIHIYFNSTSPLTYNVVYNPEAGSAEIRMTKETVVKTGKLVVIDPGHGGYDPGASYGDLKEKSLNLKIALKVDEILISKGIKTYMTRTSDVFVPLYDRANIANDMNASLFLSIHNNSFNSIEYGTETLSYPSDISRQFASIVQKSLVSALGTKDRGIINRPNLVVLHATKMPAALAEIAFISNPEDRKKLQDEDFLNRAAEALADAVIKALDTMT